MDEIEIPRNFRIDGKRLDAVQTVNLRRALEHVRTQTYDKHYPDMKGRIFVPTDNSVPTGAESVVYDSYEELGEAEITTSYADDAPMVDVRADSTVLRIRGMQTKYGYTLQELRAAAMSGSGLIPRKAFAARKVIEQKHNKIILLGDARWGLKGLFNLADTCVYTVVAGATSSKAWASKPPLEILADLFAMENTISTVTEDAEHPDTLILPLSRHKLIKQTPMGDGLPGTILQFFMNNSDHIKTVLNSTELESNSLWTGRRMVAYERDAEYVQYVGPQPFEQLMPEHSGMRTTTVCHSRTGGVQATYSKSIWYGAEI